MFFIIKRQVKIPFCVVEDMLKFGFVSFFNHKNVLQKNPWERKESRSGGINFFKDFVSNFECKTFLKHVKIRPCKLFLTLPKPVTFRAEEADRDHRRNRYDWENDTFGDEEEEMEPVVSTKTKSILDKLKESTQQLNQMNQIAEDDARNHRYCYHKHLKSGSLEEDTVSFSLSIQAWWCSRRRRPAAQTLQIPPTAAAETGGAL